VIGERGPIITSLPLPRRGCGGGGDKSRPTFHAEGWRCVHRYQSIKIAVDISLFCCYSWWRQVKTDWPVLNEYSMRVVADSDPMVGESSERMHLLRTPSWAAVRRKPGVGVRLWRSRTRASRNRWVVPTRQI